MKDEGLRMKALIVAIGFYSIGASGSSSLAFIFNHQAFILYPSSF